MLEYWTECDKYSLSMGETIDGCDGVAVSTVGCGPASPGSIPGHGPMVFFYHRQKPNFLPKL